MKGGDMKCAPTMYPKRWRLSSSLYISFPDAIMSVSKEVSRRGNGKQVKNEPTSVLFDCHIEYHPTFLSLRPLLWAAALSPKNET